MKAAPQGFRLEALTAELAAGWGVAVRELEYLPIGFGAHHWRLITSWPGGDLFGAAHDLDLVGRGSSRSARLSVLSRALSTAAWLEGAGGLDFVLGPVVDHAGNPVRQFAERFALSVYPWIDGEPASDPSGVETARLVAGLHRVTPRLPRGLIAVEDFYLPHRHALEDALDHLDSPWTTGPYAEPARERLRQHLAGVRSLLSLYDDLTGQARGAESEWVLTHGEPVGPNLLRTRDGHLRLVDWDSVLVAPRERDLWELPRGDALTAYVDVTHCPVDDRRLRLYTAWYSLAEIAVYLAVFRAPHTGDDNDIISWTNYLRYLPTQEQWPELGAFSQ
jgi:spectinomycin phosphotransferase